MKIRILNNRPEIISLATKKIIERINDSSKPQFVLGLSTGATVLSICSELALAVQENLLSLKNVVVFYAGEYVNYSRSSSYYQQRLQEEFFSKVDLQAKNIHTFNGFSTDIESECLLYEQKIQSLGGIDLFVGSLGTDGELAFNEPGSSLKSRTRIKTLTSNTINSDARFFNNSTSSVPKQVLTMGIDTIFESKEILIVVYGTQKAFALKNCLELPISDMQPASILQAHPKTSFYIDKIAARLLSDSLKNG